METGQHDTGRTTDSADVEELRRQEIVARAGLRVNQWWDKVFDDWLHVTRETVKPFGDYSGSMCVDQFGVVHPEWRPIKDRYDTSPDEVHISMLGYVEDAVNTEYDKWYSGDASVDEHGIRWDEMSTRWPPVFTPLDRAVGEDDRKDQMLDVSQRYRKQGQKDEDRYQVMIGHTWRELWVELYDNEEQQICGVESHTMSFEQATYLVYRQHLEETEQARGPWLQAGRQGTEMSPGIELG